MGKVEKMADTREDEDYDDADHDDADSSDRYEGR